MTVAAAYLARLNAEQRRAVEHGVGAHAAGAAAGHRRRRLGQDQHARPPRRALIVNGADPRRILLMTFSRRAAAEMARRVERIAAQVLGRDAASSTDALTWAGTFHGIGARLLRDYAARDRPRSGLHDPRPRGFAPT